MGNSPGSPAKEAQPTKLLLQKAPRRQLAAGKLPPKVPSLTQTVAAVNPGNPGTRVRLVCSSCGTRCEVFVPQQSPKPMRYKVRCPNCKAINDPPNRKAINDPQLYGSSAKSLAPKRKVRLDHTAPAPYPQHEPI